MHTHIYKCGRDITVNKIKALWENLLEKNKKASLTKKKKKYHQHSHVNRSLLHYTNTKYIQTAFFRYNLEKKARRSRRKMKIKERSERKSTKMWTRYKEQTKKKIIFSPFLLAFLS